jgi:lysophospholipase L1-like esterase
MLTAPRDFPRWFPDPMKIQAVVLWLGLIGTALRAPVEAATSDSVPNSELSTIFFCGDSTAKSPGDIMGWGTPIAEYFDAAKVTVNNVAHAGTSSRTYYETDWPKVLPLIKPGDFVLEVFGINDGGLRTPNGLGDEVDPTTGYHTYGWYMAKMATDAREKGARVFLLTVTTRNIWTNPKATFRDATILTQEPGYNSADDRIERGTGNGRYTLWTKEVGARLQLPVLDLTNLLADRYEQIGREKVNANFKDHNHTFPAGADLVAATIVSGLKAFQNSPFTPLLSAKGRAVETADRKHAIEAKP